METVLAEQGEDARSVIMMEPGVAGEPRELPGNRQEAVVGDLDTEVVSLFAARWDGGHL